MDSTLSDLILYAAGVLLSVLFTYFPGLKTWYEAQSGKKALIMLGLSLLVAIVYFALACTVLAAKLGITISCSTDGALLLVIAFIKIAVTNQATYLLTKK